METEIWKDVVGYEGLYQVSNFGRVKRFFKSVKEQILKPHSNGFGYLIVGLCKNKVGKPFRVHRLVASAFIPNPDNLPQVNHRDEDKANNRVENLEWCTAKYNANYGTRNKKLSKSRSKKIDQYTLDGKFVRTWSSVRQIGRELRLSNVCACCKGKIRQAGNFIWKYHQDQAN